MSIIIYLLMILKTAYLVNTVDLDQVPRFAASDLDIQSCTSVK